jgi:2-furoate---CoA ligase
MINSGGENVYPEDIEDALVRCPAITDVVVVGLPDDRWGSAIAAFAVPTDGVAFPRSSAPSVSSRYPRFRSPRWGRSCAAN